MRDRMGDPDPSRTVTDAFSEAISNWIEDGRYRICPLIEFRNPRGISHMMPQRLEGCVISSGLFQMATSDFRERCYAARIIMSTERYKALSHGRGKSGSANLRYTKLTPLDVAGVRRLGIDAHHIMVWCKDLLLPELMSITYTYNNMYLGSDSPAADPVENIMDSPLLVFGKKTPAILVCGIEMLMCVHKFLYNEGLRSIVEEAYRLGLHGRNGDVLDSLMECRMPPQCITAVLSADIYFANFMGSTAAILVPDGAPEWTVVNDQAMDAAAGCPVAFVCVTATGGLMYMDRVAIEGGFSLRKTDRKCTAITVQVTEPWASMPGLSEVRDATVFIAEAGTLTNISGFSPLRWGTTRVAEPHFVIEVKLITLDDVDDALAELSSFEARRRADVETEGDSLW